MNTGGPLDFHATIATADLNRQAAEVERRIMGIASVAEREAVKMDSSLRRLSQVAVGAFAFGQLSDLPGQILRVRGEMQSLEISLTTILRSKSQADALLNSVVKFAADTPFSSKEAATGAKQLLAYGFAAKDIIPTLGRLGDVAAGLGLPLERLTFLYGTTKTSGRLFTQDLNQFVSSGVPLVQALAAQFSVAEDQVRKLVEEGKVGFPEVKKAIEALTSGSGIFAGTVTAQSKSLNGLREQLSSAYDAMLNDIGKKNEGIFSDSLKTATEVAQNYETVVKTLGVVAAGYGGMKAATLLYSVAQQQASLEQARNIAVANAQAVAQANATVSTERLTLSQIKAARATAVASAAQAQAQVVAAESQLAAATIAGRAQSALSAVFSVNPWVLAGTAVAALVAAYFAFREETIEVKSGQDLLLESSKEVTSKFKEQGSEVKTLISILGNQNVAESERLKAYEKLKTISPDIIAGLDFQKAKTADLTKELKNYLSELERKIRLESGQGKLKQAFEQSDNLDEPLEAARKLYLQKQKTAEALRKAQSSVSSPGGGTFGITPGNQASQAQLEAQAALVDYNRLATQKKQALQAVDEVKARIGSIYSESGKASLEAERTELELTQATIKDKLSPAYKLVEDRIKAVNDQLETLSGNQKKAKPFSEVLAESTTPGQLRAAKAFADTDDKLDELAKKVKSSIGSAINGSTEKSALVQLEKEIDRLQGKKTKAEKDADKIGPYGSMSYWDNVVKKAEEVLSKTPVENKGLVARNQAALENAKRKAEEIHLLLESPAGTVKYFENIAAGAQRVLEVTPVTDTAAIEKQKQIIIKAKADAEEAGKKIAVLTFEGEIEEKQRLYELYEKWVTAYGQQSADKQFADLIASGQSYVDYLNVEINKLESKKTTGKFTPKDAENLISLNDRRNLAANNKGPVEEFNEQLASLQRHAKSTAEYISLLLEKESQIGTRSSTDNIAKRLTVTQKIAEAQQQLKSELTGYLETVAGSEEQRLLITAKYASLRKAVEDKYQKDKGEAYRKALSDVNKGEANELKEVNEQVAQSSEAFKKLDRVILESGRAGFKRRIADLKEYIDNANEAERKTQKFQEKLKEYNDGVKSIKKDSIPDFNTFATLAGSLGDALSQTNGSLGEAGKLLSGIASQSKLISVYFDENSSDADKIAASIQGVLNIVGILTSSANERKQAELAYYTAVIGQQRQYNLLLNEQIGLRSQKNESVFTQDFTGRLKDGVAQLDDAQKKYQESIDKLNEGKAKNGQRDAVDWSKVGQGAASGAAIGAIAGPIGAGIGAAIGSIIGLFGGEKKEDQFGALLQEYPELIKKSANGWEDLNDELATTLIQQDLVDDATKALLQDTIDWQKKIEDAKNQIRQVISSSASGLGDKLRSGLVGAFQDGTDAAIVFKGSVEDILSEVLSQMIFSNTLGPALKQLQDELEASVGSGGDNNWIDDFGRFSSQAAEMSKKYTDALQAAQDAAKAAGLDIFKPSGASGGSQSTALTGAVKGVTQETASVIAGQMNAIRIAQAQAQSLMNSQLFHLANIDSNTARIEQTNKLLDSIDGSLSRTFNGLRAKGIL